MKKLFLIPLLFALPAFAQNCSPFMGISTVQFLGNDGTPLTNGALYSYLGGSSQQQAMFSDPACTVPTTNPLTFTTGGRATIWLTSSALYKFVLCSSSTDGPSCAAGDTLATADLVPGGATSSGGGGGAPFITNSANPATSGILRLASSDAICWRNVANSANLCFTKDSHDLLSWATAFKLPEIAAPASVSGFDIIYADSTAHRYGQCSNGTSCQQLVNAGVDINGSDQVNQLHFGATATPLSGTAPTTNQFLQWNGTSIVGASLPTTLNKQDPQGSATTGNGSTQTVYTYTLPGGSLATGKCLDIAFYIQKATGTNNFTPTLTFGATTIMSAQSGSNLTTWELTAKVCNNSGSTTAQWSAGHELQQVNAFVQSASPAENTANAIVITATANVASPDTWKGLGFTVIPEP